MNQVSSTTLKSNKCVIHFHVCDDQLLTKVKLIFANNFISPRSEKHGLVGDVIVTKTLENEDEGIYLEIMLSIIGFPSILWEKISYFHLPICSFIFIFFWESEATMESLKADIAQHNEGHVEHDIKRCWGWSWRVYRGEMKGSSGERDQMQGGSIIEYGEW